MNSRYEIRVKGIFDGRWTAWFEDLLVTSDGEEPVISGPVAAWLVPGHGLHPSEGHERCTGGACEVHAAADRR